MPKNILDKIQHSFWLRVISGIVFLLMLYGNNALEIARVNSSINQRILTTKSETLKEVKEDYVRKDLFQTVKEDISDIKQDVKTLLRNQ